jgi:hypothetical protein
MKIAFGKRRRFAVLLVGLFALAGCHRIGFIGDSMISTQQSVLKDKAAKALFYSYVSAQNGLNTGQVVARVQQGLADYPDTWSVVLNTGTNDVGGDNVNWQTDFDALFALVDDRPCVVLTTVNALVNAANPPLIVTAEEINAYMTAHVASHANYRLVDWNAAVATTEGLLANDAIHPSAAGKEWMSNAYIAATQSCLPGATTTTEPETSTTTTSVPEETTTTSTTSVPEETTTTTEGF